jgi:transcriptional regulator with XRE-family HTH domain
MQDEYPEATPNPFTEWLRIGLVKHGKSQKELADYLGISQSVMSRVCSGERPMRLRELTAIATFFGETPPSGNPAREAVVGLRIAVATVKESVLPDMGAPLGPEHAAGAIRPLSSRHFTSKSRNWKIEWHASPRGLAALGVCCAKS